MSSESKATRSGGIGFLGMLTIVFITLKLCGVIDWSWWWVLSPLWLPLTIVLTLFAGFVLVLGTITFIVACFEK